MAETMVFIQQCFARITLSRLNSPILCMIGCCSEGTEAEADQSLNSLSFQQMRFKIQMSLFGHADQIRGFHWLQGNGWLSTQFIETLSGNVCATGLLRPCMDGPKNC